MEKNISERILTVSLLLFICISSIFNLLSGLNASEQRDYIKKQNEAIQEQTDTIKKNSQLQVCILSANPPRDQEVIDECKHE